MSDASRSAAGAAAEPEVVADDARVRVTVSCFGGDDAPRGNTSTSVDDLDVPSSVQGATATGGHMADIGKFLDKAYEG